MKRIITLAALFIGTLSFGQLSYTSSNHASGNYNQQMSSVTVGINAFDFDTTGANFTWDYTLLGIDLTGNLGAISPASSGYQTPFVTQCVLNGGGFTCLFKWNNLTNVGLVDLDSFPAVVVTLYDVTTMAKLANNRLIGNIKGLKIKDTNNLTVPLVTEYYDSDTILTFPFTYQDSGKSYGSWGLDLNSVGQNIIYKVTYDREWTVEGWGTLITPFSTHSSVLKVKTTLDQVDSLSYLGTAFGIPRKIVEYTWYDAAFGLPVMKAEGIETLGLTTITTVRYYDQRFASIDETYSDIKFTVFPNPAQEFIQVSTTENKPTSYQLIDMQGKVVGSSSFTSQIAIGELTSGFYFIQLLNENGVIGVEKFVKE